MALRRACFATGAGLTASVLHVALAAQDATLVNVTAEALAEGADALRPMDLPTSSFDPPPALIKCIAAMVAGGVFAVIGMVVEGRYSRQKPVSRDELAEFLPKRPSLGGPGSKPESAEASAVGTGMRRRRAEHGPSPPPSFSSAADEESAKQLEPSQAAGAEGEPSAVAPRPASRFGRELSEIEMAERRVISILNKLTRERFDSLYLQLLECCDSDEMRAEIVQIIAREVFAKATMQHSFIELYADLCFALDGDLRKHWADKVDFKHILLTRCRESFNFYLEPLRVDETLGEVDQYEALVKIKTKMLGNVMLIGRLLLLKMVSTKIIFHCTDELLSIGSGEALETLCAFLGTIGGTFDMPEWQGQLRLEEVFTQVELLTVNPQQCPRIKCLLKDLLDKRRGGWH